MEELNPYERKYKQMNLLGKGNYGKVYKVKLNNGKEGKDSVYFVAKKMFLEGLSEQEVKSAYGQIQILERLNDEIKKNKVPFIVGYEQFFRIDNQLIIIMEYCEEGDLSTYIKALKKNGQRLSEKLIGYWFTQLLFGLRVLHSKSILHRDLKSANIFLTKNYSLKIGDFGISKVLERSSAITCIGTPLYLSPEVCNNQPYTYSSDMWALACIVYQMCALRYPFQASNMIVLAKKIVMDKVQPIPNYFDRELNDIIMSMFQKQPKKRMTAQQIFKTPYFNKLAKNFLQDQGRIKELALPVNLESSVQKKQVVESAGGEQQETMKTINSVVAKTGGGDTLSYSGTLSHKQQMTLRKEQQRRKKEQQAARAARENYLNNQQQAKQAKMRNLMQTEQLGSMSKADKMNKEKTIQNYNKAVSELRIKQRKEEPSEMEKQQEIPLATIFNTIHNIKITDAEEEFQDVPPLPGNSSFVPVPVPATTLKKSSSQTPVPVPVAEKISKIKQEVKQEIQEEIAGEEELQQYYDDDFEEYVEPSASQKIELKRESEDVASYYQDYLQVSTMSPTKKTMVQQALKPIVSSRSGKIQSKQSECVKLVGEKRYRQLKKLFQAGKINLATVPKDTKYSPEEKKTLYYIQEITELSQ